jgi:hypothetical protein
MVFITHLYIMYKPYAFWGWDIGYKGKFFFINKTKSKNAKLKMLQIFIFLESILPLRVCYLKSFDPRIIKI